MRALSLWQPWASLIAVGVKKVETRSWSTPYRGPVAIHAARTREAFGEYIDDNDYERMCELLAKHGSPVSQMPFGAVVALGRLVDCRRTEDVRGDLDPLELSLGNYGSNRFAWQFADVRRLVKPVPLRGHQGLWGLQASLIQDLEIIAAAS